MQISHLIDTQRSSNGKQRAHLELLDQLISQGELSATLHQYNLSSEPPILEAAASSPSNHRDNESKNHIRLKAIAAQYLRETGSKPLFEQETWFGIADVGIETGNRVAECGTIRTGKFLEAFGRESTQQLLGEQNPAYNVLDELLYIPYTDNEHYPPVTILSLQSE